MLSPTLLLSDSRSGLFVTSEGKNVFSTFALVQLVVPLNYMTSPTPPVPGSWMKWLPAGWFEIKEGLRVLSNQGGASLASVGSGLFLLGRFTGAGLLRKFAAHRVLGTYAALSVGLSALVFCKLGWLPAACVFPVYFFMPIMFSAIFSLGIFGLVSA